MFAGTFITAHHTLDILVFLITLRSAALRTVRLRARRRTLLHQIPWAKARIDNGIICAATAAAAVAMAIAGRHSRRWQLCHFLDLGRQHRWQMGGHRFAPHRWLGQWHTPREAQFQGPQIGGGRHTWIKESGRGRRRGAYDATPVHTQRIVGNNIAGLDPGIGANGKTKVPWLNYFDESLLAARKYCGWRPISRFLAFVTNQSTTSLKKNNCLSILFHFTQNLFVIVSLNA